MHYIINKCICPDIYLSLAGTSKCSPGEWLSDYLMNRHVFKPCGGRQIPHPISSLPLSLATLLFEIEFLTEHEIPGGM